MQTFVYPDEIYRELAQTSFFCCLYGGAALAGSRAVGVMGESHGAAGGHAGAQYRGVQAQEVPLSVYPVYGGDRAHGGAPQGGLGDSFGGSLETTQFDRLLSHLSSLLLASEGQTDEELLQTWEDLMHYFRTLVENASDYLAHLPVLHTEVRSALLSWVDRCLPQQGRAVALENGTRMRLVLGSSSARVCVHSEDGDLWLPAGLSLRLTRHSLESMSRTCVTCSASLSPCTSTTS